MLTKQIGALDIVVYLFLSANTHDPDDKGILLERRWDIEKSPFFQVLSHWTSVIRYPHTGDTSNLIRLHSIRAWLEIICTKTTEDPDLIYIQAKYCRVLKKGNTGTIQLDIKRENLVDILLKEGWTYP